jgi:hypothetical protein
VHVAARPAGGLGDVTAAGEMECADSKVAEAGHDAGAGAGVGAGVVFAVDGVADLLRGWASVAVADSSRLRSSEADEGNVSERNRCGARPLVEFTWWGGER